MVIRPYVQAGHLRSSPWRFWNHGDDVYISARNMGGLLKASLHTSGWLNFSFTSEYYGANNIEPQPESRHLGRQELTIASDAMQIVFYVQIPVAELTRCQFRTSRMQALEVPPDAKGTVMIKVIHVPEDRRSELLEADIPGLLGTMCEGKYQVVWHHHHDVVLAGFSCSSIVEFEDVKYDRDTRAITMGYIGNTTAGFFLDTARPQPADGVE